MKIGDYEQMMSYLTRKSFKEGTPDTSKPKPKPLTEDFFKEKADLYIKGLIGGFPQDEMLLKLQGILDKAVEQGIVKPEEGINYFRNRKQELLDFVKENPGETLPSLNREEFAEGSPKPQVTEEIKKQFPEGDFDKYKYGFSTKDPKYEKVRSLARTEQRAFYEKTPERVEKRRELHRKYYQEDPQKILTRAKIAAAKPERVAKKKAYDKKQYYELGKREKDLARLRGEAFKKNVGSWQLTQDNVLLSDMVRAAQKGDTSLEIVRGGPNNSIVGVKEGNKIYHPVTGTGKPIADVPEKSIPITKHPLHKKRLSFKKQANAFANTKVPGTNITYGKALDVLQSEKAGTPLQKKNPAEFEHTKGVATDYSKGQIALRTANREKDVILNSLKQGFITKEEADKKLKKIGVKAFFKNRYIGAPTINPEKQFDDFKKYVDRQLNLNPELIKQTKIEKAKTIPGVTTADKIKRPERALIRDQIKDFQIRTGGPTLGANLGLLKGIGETLPYFGTPLGAAVLTGGFGLDLKDPMQRVGIEAELALAPELVKQTSKLVKNPLLQRALNLGLSPAAAMRLARIASPVGIASLGGEALYKYGKFVKDELNRIEQMSPQEREAYNIEQQEQMGVAAADGGLIRQGFRGGGMDMGASSSRGSTSPSRGPAGGASRGGNYGGPDRSKVSDRQERNNQRAVAEAQLVNKMNQAQEARGLESVFQKFRKHDKFTDLLKESRIPNYHQLGAFDFMARFPNINPNLAKNLGYGYQRLEELGRAAFNPNVSFKDAYNKANEEARLNAVGIDDFFNPESKTYQTYGMLSPDIFGNVNLNNQNYATGGRIGFYVGGGADASQDDFGGSNNNSDGGNADDNREQYGAKGQYSGPPSTPSGGDDNREQYGAQGQYSGPPSTPSDDNNNNKINLINTLNKFRPDTFVNPYNYSIGLNKNIGPFGLNVGINTLGILGIDDPRTEEDESEQDDYGISAGFNTDVLGGILGLGAGYSPTTGTNFGLSFSKQFSQGGRVNFADGYDPKRRKFMKAAAGIASIPVFGRILKPVVKGMEAAGPAVTQAATEAEKIFFKLVDAVKNKGIMDKLDRVTGGRLSGAYHKYKDAEVLEDAGSITAKFKTDKGAPAEIVYVKPQKRIDPKTGKEVEYPGQFDYEAQEIARINPEGDVDIDAEFEIIDSLEDVKKLIDD